MQQAVLLTAAAGGHPLIDIDGTVFIQLAIFLVLTLIATRMLFRPYLRLRDERAAGIEGAREEAARMQAQATAQLSDYEAKLATARAKAEDERRSMRAEASAYEREVVDKSRAEATNAVEHAYGVITRDTEAARAQLAPRAGEIARQVATKLLGREVA